MVSDGVDEAAARARAAVRYAADCGQCMPTPSPPPRAPPPFPPPASPPPPPPPSPPAIPPVPLVIGSFFVIGDWGYYHGFKRNGDFRREWSLCTDQCQTLIADQMRAEVKRREGTNAPIRFVVNAGDSFYPAGSKSLTDEKWETYWGEIYHGLPKGTPWYSVYGNHDYGQDNRVCGCEHGDPDGESCVQVQKHGYRSKKSEQLWYMPKMNYFVQPDNETVPGLIQPGSIEVLALDLNFYDSHVQCTWVSCTASYCSDCSNASIAAGARCADIDPHTGTPNPKDGSNDLGCTIEDCRTIMEKRAKRALELLVERVERATRDGAQLIVFSHYPTDFLGGTGFKIGYRWYHFLELLSRTNVRVVYFGAHRHSTDNTTVGIHDDYGKLLVNPIKPNQNWVVGGGGGWSCDGHFDEDNQGVVVLDIYDDGSVGEVKPLYVSREKCCFPNPRRYDDDGQPLPHGQLRDGDIANPFAAIGKGRRLGAAASAHRSRAHRRANRRAWAEHHAAMHATDGRRLSGVWDNATGRYLEEFNVIP